MPMDWVNIPPHYAEGTPANDPFHDLYVCALCSYSVVHEYDVYMTHVLNKHYPLGSNKCPVCDTTVATHGLIRMEHYVQEHTPYRPLTCKINIGPDPLRPIECGYRTAYINQFWAHFEEKHRAYTE